MTKSASTDAEFVLRRDLFLATFAILVLELAVIRWMSQQVRVFAYLNNIILIGAFLGMGLGVALGKRQRRLVHLALPALALLTGVLAFSKPLGLLHIGFPDTSMAMWGVEPAAHFGLALLQIMVLFAAVVAVFVFAAVPVGAIFAEIDSLAAYAADLAGSAAGVLAMTVLSAMATPPWVWFLAGALPLLWLSRRIVSVVCLLMIIGFTAWTSRGAVFSPYYRIDIFRNQSIAGSPLQLSVNRDFHQYMLDLSDRTLANPSTDRATRAKLQHAEKAYRLPFELSDQRQAALILGAGTGNDAAAALRAGFQRVVAVDIDPQIVRLGERLHPERPYSDPRVTRVVNDARAYLERAQARSFDVVAFGLLDSHAMFSAMASLRLDNYVYTVESIRRAWQAVRPGGVLSVSFAVGNREWISDRLRRVVFEATGEEPLAVFHGVQGGRSLVVKKGLLPAMPFSSSAAPTGVVPLHVLPQRDLQIRPATDDWPFLYLNPGVVPWGYLAVLAGVLALAVVSTRLVFGPGFFEAADHGLMMFFLGAAFLLIETRGVTTLSLLFGSTWMVNSAVFFGILVTVWMANWCVRRFKPTRLEPFFALLVLALVLNFLIPIASLLELPIVARGLIGGLLNALPVGVAGVIFSALLRRAQSPERALGANLLGAVFGGCLEYLSMSIGLSALVLLSLTLYLLALLLMLRRKSFRAASAVS